MKDLLLVVVALVATFSIALNFVLVNKVNYLRAARKAEKRMAQTLISSAVKTAITYQNDIATKEDINKVLEQQIEVARDVVEKLQDKLLGYKEDIIAASHMHNKLYELLTQKKIVKRIWDDNFIEFYDINRMSVEEIHQMFGHPLSAQLKQQK